MGMFDFLGGLMGRGGSSDAQELHDSTVQQQQAIQSRREEMMPSQRRQFQRPVVSVNVSSGVRTVGKIAGSVVRGVQSMSRPVRGYRDSGGSSVYSRERLLSGVTPARDRGSLAGPDRTAFFGGVNRTMLYGVNEGIEGQLPFMNRGAGSRTWDQGFFLGNRRGGRR